MKVVGRKTGGYLVFTIASGGNNDAMVYVFGRYMVGSAGGTNNGLKFSVWGARDADELFGSSSSGVSGKNTVARFYDSRPSWIPASSVFDDAAMQLEWDEMENGDLVSTTNLTNDAGNVLKSSYKGEEPEDTISIGGKQYTLRFINLGYLSSSGDTSLTSSNEFVKYVYGARNSAAEGGLKPGWAKTARLVNSMNQYVPSNAYGIPWYTSDSYTTGAVAGVFKRSSSTITGTGSMRTMIVAHAASPKPWIEGLPSSFGEHSKGFSLVSKVNYDGSGNISWSVKSGDAVVASASGVSASSPISITTGQLTGLGLGQKQLTVTVSSAGGSNSYTTSVTVTTNMIDVQGDPVTCDRMPVACSLVNVVTLGSGATQKWYVTNNANDSAPSWEEYTGPEHEFSNTTKTSESWAVSWRCQIGGSSATSQSKLTQKVGMAVVYGEGD